jgi:glycerophosphoryl diester phosphodiesterase
LDAIAVYANGIGPSVGRIFNRRGEAVDDFALVKGAHARGMVVHPYTMRADRLPSYANTFDELLEKVLIEAGADGLFTDHPGQVVEFIRVRSEKAP